MVERRGRRKAGSQRVAEDPGAGRGNGLEPVDAAGAPCGMPADDYDEDTAKAFDKGAEVLERRLGEELREILPDPLERPCRE